jgi:thymidylate synthase
MAYVTKFIIRCLRALTKAIDSNDFRDTYEVTESTKHEIGKSFYEADTIDDLLASVYTDLLKESSGTEATRGNFVEFIGCMLVLNNPRARLSRSHSRGKIFSGLAELLWYLSGSNRLDFMEYYLKGKYAKESEDGETVRSAYGERLFGPNGINQMQNVIVLLSSKPTSRRAVIQLFDASDLTKNFYSVPCTCTLQFIARQGKLNMLVNMRSNDAYKGLAHDIFSFTMVQEIVARTVGLDVGTYKHCVGSLHLYTDPDKDGKSDKDRIQEYLQEGFFKPTPMLAMPEGDPWPSIKRLQKFEKDVRLNGHSSPCNVCGSDYWDDLCRLLAFFYHYKQEKAASNGHIKVCDQIRSEMSTTIYDLFLVTKMDDAENGKKKGMH